MNLGHVTVGDLMSASVITVLPTDSMEHAESEMRLGDVRHLPVVDKDQRLVGIISSRDLALAKGRGKARVGQYMSTRLRTVGPTMLAHEAAGLMLQHKIGALPVVDDEGDLVGLLTDTDFLRFAHQVLGGYSHVVQLSELP
ncbi:MAG: CBS domain-containing protein [Deltaproteobacteria bacterium]|nr:CBS domain-containing protein [Deltaproteobacteria bacterium]